MILLLKSKFEWKDLEHTVYESSEGVHPEIERLFLSRNLGTVADLKKNSKVHDIWHDAFWFKEMKNTVDRINSAIKNQESMLIYGDYDADGCTSTALLVKALRQLGANVSYYIPHRFFEGYGPNEDAFLQAVDQGYQLIITVDCGITAVVEAQILKENEVDLIIVDHHQAKTEIPDALAIIHPEFDENYPFNFLAGAGVVLKLVEALKDKKLDADDYMLAMFGTVGDVVDLVDENRTIVKRGLSALQKTSSPGVLALLATSDVNQYEADETTVAFAICPRLNAPGRMDEASMVVELLLADDPYMAGEYAKEIEMMNTERKAATTQITEEAIKLAQAKPLENLKVLVLYQPHWHEGVLGIVASKVADKFGKAVLVLTNSDEDQIKGSARSPDGFDIMEALRANEDLLAKYGGHESAAGLTLATDDLSKLEKGLNDVFANRQMVKSVTVDMALTLKELDLKWLSDLDHLAPFGQGNQRPVVKFTGIQIKNVKRIGTTHQHLKFTMYDHLSSLDSIFFNGAPAFIYLTANAKFDVLCEIELNEWNGNQKLQARIIDLKCDEIQLLDLRNQQLDAEFSPMIKDGFVIDRVFDSKEMLRLAFKESGSQNVVLKPLEKMTMPAREKFIFVFKAVKKHAPFTLTREIVNFFEKENISKAMLGFIIRVFTEIGLMSYENGVVALCESSEKMDYKMAPSYKNRQARVVVHEFLELGGADEILKYMIGDELK